ncbi:hypothetical protein [Caenimonas aquaedulcis]|uniref:Uncharacterized protein n=1 Tax=Caenimonas aquaedulcis TaxID=2793270 RepID=A0A931H722_9BURK|nr:hypothetical protein [Caenimonas aquaedulcis]MBG9389874.1 hypothetical protein [Caenimonas aquaedulcis]
MAGALAGCSDCQNQILDSAWSPTGALKAMVFHRECGATVGFNTQIAIVPAGASAGIVGNVVIVDGKSAARVKWLSERTLLVENLGSGRVFKKEGEIEGVAIRYEP